MAGHIGVVKRRTERMDSSARKGEGVEEKRKEREGDGSMLQRAFPISEPFKSDVDLWVFHEVTRFLLDEFA